MLTFLSSHVTLCTCSKSVVAVVGALIAEGKRSIAEKWLAPVILNRDSRLLWGCDETDHFNC